MPEPPKTQPDKDTKPDAGQTQAAQPPFVELPFSPSNPPDLHARPLIKSRIDRAGLRKALGRVGIDPDE